jgi:hypothetical protein
MVLHIGDDSFEIGLLVGDVLLIGILQLLDFPLVLVLFLDEALEQPVVELVVTIEGSDQVLDLLLVDGLTHLHLQRGVLPQLTEVYPHAVLHLS